MMEKLRLHFVFFVAGISELPPHHAASYLADLSVTSPLKGVANLLRIADPE